MSVGTKIQWTETTWNPVTGCDRISPGCQHCYALTLAKRLKAMGSAKYQTDGDPRTSGPGFGMATHDEALTEPLRWRRPRRVFVNSMADLGHAHVSDQFIARTFAVMAAASQHQFQLLTKRPRRFTRLLAAPAFRDQVVTAAHPSWPLPNVWMGVSIESDDYCWRVDELRRTPAAVRFLSLEPLLGPLPSLNLDGIDWVVIGGESGPRHRPLDLDWVRDLRDRCQQLAIPLFFKQVGGPTPKSGGRLLDGRTWDQFPTYEAEPSADQMGHRAPARTNTRLEELQSDADWVRAIRHEIKPLQPRSNSLIHDLAATPADSTKMNLDRGDA